MAEERKKRSKSTETHSLTLQYVRSAIGSPKKHKLVIKGLGFRRLKQTVVRRDTPAIRGMVAKVPHLVIILRAE